MITVAGLGMSSNAFSVGKRQNLGTLEARAKEELARILNSVPAAEGWMRLGKPSVQLLTNLMRQSERYPPGLFFAMNDDIVKFGKHLNTLPPSAFEDGHAHSIALARMNAYESRMLGRKPR